MDYSLFQSAVFIGVSMAAPVGPIALVCLRTTLQSGWRHGYIAGLGVASADASYGLVGATGVQGVLQFFIQLKLPLGLLGAAFLLYLAWQFWHQEASQVKLKQDDKNSGSNTSYPRSFFTLFMLTLSNPMTILSFISIFASINLRNTTAQSWQASLTMVAGIFAGSAFWWLFLCSLIASIKHRLDASHLKLLNRISAVCVAGFAIWQIGHLLS